MISGLEIVLWVFVLILGFVSLIYEFFPLIKLKGLLKSNYSLLYIGLISGYISAFLSFLFETDIITNISAGHYFLMVAVLFIGYGSIKIINMMWYIPESFLVALNKRAQSH